MKSGTATSFRLVFTTVNAGATSVAIDFNGSDAGTARWTNATPGGLVNATQTVSSASCASGAGAESGSTALPGSITAAGSGSTITISNVTALSSATSYCVDLTSSSAVTTPTAGHEGEYHPTVTAGSDSVTVAVRVISNDQVVVSAIVPPTFNLAFGANSDSFPSTGLTTSAQSSNGVTFTVNTNAQSGWLVLAKDPGTTTGLVSASLSNYQIPWATAGASHGNCSSSTECYRTAIYSISQGTGAGTTSADTQYNGAVDQGSGLDATFRRVVTSSGTANAASFVLKESATVSPTTPAATDYTDTITVVGTGNF